MFPGLVVDALPWWLAAALAQLAILVFGMALDETYVNRATVFTAALAVYVHTLLASEVGVLVGLYVDVGLVVGAYGVYAYVVDGYVGSWFRILAFLVYSPLSAFLVILTAGPTAAGVEILFAPALAAAAVANLRLSAALEPNDPYYFGPESPEAFERAVAEIEEAVGTAGESGEPAEEDGSVAGGHRSAAGAVGSGPAADAVGGESVAGTGASGPAAGAVGGESVAGTGASGPAAGAGGGDPPAAGATSPANRAGPAEVGRDADRPGPTPAGGDPTERGILPEFMRRL